MKIIATTMIGLSITAVSALAAADGLTQRCMEDPLSVAQAIGRNAWARNCGWMSASAETVHNEEAEYIVFTTGKYGGTPNIPISTAASCTFNPALVKLGYCMAGCYTPTQELLFNGSYVGIEDAFNAQSGTVTALTSDATVGALNFSEQKIRTFVAGKTSESIFVLEGEDGETLEVTSEHPLVRDDGTIVTAKTLNEGDQLLGARGNVIHLVGVSTYLYEGLVWNVQPASHDKLENILVARGFLTGSVRFQNEWANDNFRLSLRDDFDVKDL